MKKINFLVLIAFAAFMVTGCGGLKKMQERADEVRYKVTPEVLEEHGDVVAVKVDASYPAKYFNKKATLNVVPVLKYDGGETAFPAKALQGEKVMGNNQVVNFTTGGNVSYAGTVAFKEEMMKSELVVRAEASMKGKSLTFSDYKIADGVIATPKLVKVDPKPIMMADKFQRIIPEEALAEILYIINRADVRTSELKKEDIVKLQEFIKNADKDPKIELKNLEISAYASPDGPIDLNDKLAQKRQGSAETYIQKELKKSKIDKINEPGFVMAKYTAEDWDGFKTLMEKSDIQDKDLILRVLSMYSDPVVREKEIKNISQAYTIIADKILPKLRRSKLTVNVDKIGYSDDELRALFQTNPDQLNLEELLYTATLMPDLNNKLAVYQKAASKYPECVRAFNNIGYVDVLMGDLSGADAAFEKAKSLRASDIVNNNLGTVALGKGEIVNAEGLFSSASGAGSEVNYNLAIIKIMKGDYDAAASYLANSDEFNTALVKYLKKDYDGALATLNRVEGDFAEKYYLKAVVAAKQDKTDLLLENLRLAIAKDASLAKRAKVDLEFAKYFENSAFKALIP